MQRAKAPFHVMTKPAGPLCNLDCSYCFYLEKTKLFPKHHSFKMTDEVLEAYIKGYIEAQPSPQVSFAWQGGEPTLAGISFFRKVIDLQKKYGAGRQIENAFQTNGTLLNDEWCTFLRDEGFLVGISIDGPEHLHDAYRVDRKGAPTYRKVVRGIELCKKHRVEFNTLTVVNRKNAAHPLEVYRFLREIGSTFIQFIPLVERKADDASNSIGLGLSHPPDLTGAAAMTFEPEVTDWSVLPKQFGDFYCKIFDRWVTRDVGKVYVQLFDVTLGKWVGAPGGVCMHSETCGRAMALEHNGDLYACDHYVYPRYRLGNVLNESIAEMADSEFMRDFGEQKRSRLPKQCLECKVRFACNGDCPKHRFAYTKDGEPGLSYLCEGFYQFFTHSAPAMRTMADLYRNRRSPAEIMSMKKG
ncbi:anaerobic sulfatase-maturation protein [Coraliomargarita parva]|uniref:anaerobic sulfatase-maturation protein n=1 Tax=Coraliomargarita parva TaxID=3014050 RepID=UPI0022B43872|nr:anaerobic sulfatase-maturation protein [Coraliomargarita parva]